MKQYITWTTFWDNKQSGRHIEANVNNNWNYGDNAIVCTPLGLGNTSTDSRQLAILDIPDDVYSDSVLDRLYKSLNIFAVEKVTVGDALSYCFEWYGEGSFSLDDDEFTLVDLRPKEDFED